MLLDSYVTCIIKNIYPFHITYKKFDNRVNKKKRWLVKIVKFVVKLQEMEKMRHDKHEKKIANVFIRFDFFFRPNNEKLGFDVEID